MAATSIAGEVVTIVVDGEDFEWDKCLLRGSSAYFDAMFSCDMKESKQESVTLQDVSGDTFRMLHIFAKGGSLPVQQDNVLQILATASMLQFQSAIEECTSYLFTRLCEKNCLGVMQIADLHGLSTLYTKARRIALWEFNGVSESQEFLELSSSVLKDYLQDSMLNVGCEMQVFKAVISWIECDVTERLDDLHGILLGVLRYCSLTESELNQMCEDKYVQKSVQCQELLTVLVQHAQEQSSHHRPDGANNHCIDDITKQVSCTAWFFKGRLYRSRLHCF